ncbi:MAG: hypothetical protein QG639_35, partial [Patescibacteria group bacterium]|nr:hypothetical protein [Patescibacteria group bacterium]
MDSEAIPRTINPNLIDQAEGVRSTGDFAEALRLSRSALQIDIQPLTSQEIKEITLDRTQATLLATGARLIGESSKSIMKRSLFPWQMRSRAAAWLKEAGILYGNQDIRNAAAKIEWDHHDRPYDYDREFTRDIADYLMAVTLVMPAEKAEELQRVADTIWELLIGSLDLEDPDRHFFVLERCWFLFKSGNQMEIDAADLAEALKGYYIHFGNSNEDRLKTITVRALLVAEALMQPTIVDYALKILSDLQDLDSLPNEEKK